MAYVVDDFADDFAAVSTARGDGPVNHFTDVHANKDGERMDNSILADDTYSEDGDHEGTPDGSKNRPACSIVRSSRREKDTYEGEYIDRNSPPKNVSFNPAGSASALQSSIPEEVPENGYRAVWDGRHVVLMSFETQTDWSWVEDAALDDTVKFMEATGEKQKVAALGTVYMSINKWKGHGSDKPLSRESRRTTDTPLSSALTRGSATSLVNPLSSGDEYGVPILDLSDDSDDSSCDDDLNEPIPQIEDNLLPSVAPPPILQYKRESKTKKDEFDSGNTISLSLAPSSQAGMCEALCEFCKQAVKPFPTVQQQETCPPEELYCCEEYKTFVEFVLIQDQSEGNTGVDFSKLTENTKTKGPKTPRSRRNIMHGQAQRNMNLNAAAQASNTPTPQQIEKSAANFYSSPAVTVTASTSSLSSSFTGTTNKSDIESIKLPPPAKTTKSEKTDRSDRVDNGPRSNRRLDSLDRGRGSDRPPVERAPERPSMPSVGHGVARQMKTINYQLSSQKCFDEGWSIIPDESPTDDDAEDEMFQAQAMGNRKWNQLVEKFYDNGEKFLTFFPDGTGHVYYPSGQVAIVVSAHGQENFYITTVFEEVDVDETPQIMAIFLPTGYATCYHANSSIRLHMNQLGGVEIDSMGTRKRDWSWLDQQQHVHAPPFQPICLGLSKHIGLRVMSQSNVKLSLKIKKRSCHFHVGSKLKLINTKIVPTAPAEDTAMIIDAIKSQIGSTLDKLSNLLRFPNSPKVSKILPPVHVTNKLQKLEQLKQQKMTLSPGSSPSSQRKKSAKPRQSPPKIPMPAVVVS